MRGLYAKYANGAEIQRAYNIVYGRFYERTLKQSFFKYLLNDI